MSKKTRILFALGLLIAVTGYFLVRDLYPKSAGRYPFLVLLVAADIYLFVSSFPLFAKAGKKTGRWLIVLHWLPLGLLLILFAGSFIAPSHSWPKPLRLYTMGLIFTGYAAKLLPLLFLALQDIIYLIKKGISKQGKKAGRNRILQYTGAVMGGLVLMLLLYGMIAGNFRYKVYTNEVVVPSLPPAFDGLRIVQVSDLHLGSWVSAGQLRKVVEKVNSLKPDIFVFTGDLVDNQTDEAFHYEEILKGVKAKYGKFSVLGNHDYGDYRTWESPEVKHENLRQMYDLHARLGWKLLRNSNTVLQIGGKPLAVIGVENWGSHGRYQKYGDVQEAMTGTEGLPFRLLLSHDPTHWKKIVSGMPETIDLTLSGHTHAFQLGIETADFRWSPSQYIYRHWAGLYAEPGSEKTSRPRYLYVNRGTGSLGYPGRVGMDPEITLIILRK
ncbi:MAG: metallophosphoesterase [Bacteroidales bacterium]|nr:metallophosphoesterase [Bacteroidales bacterium]